MRDILSKKRNILYLLILIIGIFLGNSCKIHAISFNEFGEVELIDIIPKRVNGENGITYKYLDSEGNYENLIYKSEGIFGTYYSDYSGIWKIDNNLSRIYAHPSAMKNGGKDFDIVIEVELPSDENEIWISGEYGNANKGTVRSYIYLGKENYNNPIWESTSSSEFLLNIKYEEGEKLYFAVDAGVDDLYDWSYWSNVYFFKKPLNNKVLIIINSSHQVEEEIRSIKKKLRSLGLDGDVISKFDVDLQQMLNYPLLIVHDMGDTASFGEGFINNLINYHQSGNPIYFIGDDLSNKGQSKDETWYNLIGFEMGKNGDKLSYVSVNENVNSEITQDITEFMYTQDVDITNAKLFATPIMKLNDNDAMIQYEDEYGKVVSQLFNVNFAEDVVADTDGLTQIDSLFKNSVKWLLDKNSENEILKPTIKKVTLYDEDNEIDLLKTNYTINSTDSSVFEIKLNVDWKNEELKEIILQQGSKKVSLKKETFKLKLTDVFNPEEPIYIMAVSKNGINSIAKKLNLNINKVENDRFDVPELYLEKILAGESPEDTPIIGKTQFGINISNLKYTAAYDNLRDTWKLILGYGSAVKPGENWDKVKELYQLNKTFGGKGGSFSLSSKMKFSSSALGYIEFKGAINSIDELLNGGLLVDIAGNRTFLGSQYLLMAGYVPIPLYITAGGSLYGKLNGEVTNLNTDVIKLKGNVEFNPKVVAEGGVGVNKVFTIVGADGNVGIKMNGDLSDTKLNLQIAGGLSIVARLFAHQARLDILGFEFPDNKKNSEDFNLYSVNNYSLMSRDYLNAQTEWGSSIISPLTEEDGYKNQDITILQQGIYPDSHPEIMMINDQKIMIWIRDNEERSSINRTELVFSIYDESNQKWSEPKAIYDDGTGDFYPQIAKDDNNLYVVWQNINKKFSNDDVTIDMLAKHSDIMISKFNNEKNIFDKPTNLTLDEYYDGLPMLSVKDGEIAVTWIRNSENDIFGQNHKNELMFKYYRNGKWEDTQVLTKKQSIINSLDIINNGQEQYIIYSLDVDNDPSTIDDQELVLISINSRKVIKTEQITTNNVIDSNPQFVDLDNGIGLFYYSDNQLVFSEDINEIKPNPVFKEGQGLGTDNYQILNDNNKLMVLWTKNTEDSIEVFGVKYDENSKSFDNEMLLTHVNHRIKEFDALFEDNGSILLVANVAEKIENQVDDIIYNSDGISSLALIEVNPLEDLTINQESLYIDETSYMINQSIPITFEVTNNGQEIAQGFNVEVFDESSLSPNYTTTINKTLNPGESSLVEVHFTPKEAKQYSGVIKITPLRGQDAFEGNNTTTFTVGSSDPYIKDTTSSTIDDKLSINMVLSNTSVISSENITVNIREDNEEGNVLYTTVVKKLESDVDVRLDCELDTANLKFDEERKKVLYVELISENDEKYTYNNSEFIVVTNPYQKEDVNRDNKIDILDLAEITNNYNLQYDDNEFDFKYDINRDGIIDLYDFVLISKEIQQ